jgi:DNA-directed RNA polymerase subunit RPC12/RpoP
MARPLSGETVREEVMALVVTMHDELIEWRKAHPEASLDEIAAQVTPRRRRLMGQWIAWLACLDGDGTAVEGVACPHCGRPMVYKGDPPRTQAHLEGDITLKRAYYHCPACRQALFPPRPTTAARRP